MTVSKELLSEVLNENCEDDHYELNGEVAYRIRRLDNGLEYYELHHINIYELAHKCKEWILTNKYKIFIYSDDNFEWYCQVQLFNAHEQPKEWSVADTEPEAVFKATSYIMEQLKQKE